MGAQRLPPVNLTSYSYTNNMASVNGYLYDFLTITLNNKSRISIFTVNFKFFKQNIGFLLIIVSVFFKLLKLFMFNFIFYLNSYMNLLNFAI